MSRRPNVHSTIESMTSRYSQTPRVSKIMHIASRPEYGPLLQGNECRQLLYQPDDPEGVPPSGPLLTQDSKRRLLSPPQLTLSGMSPLPLIIGVPISP
jgi:hypothetical protein